MLPIPSDGVIFKRLDGGAVAYDSTGEVYFGLNGVAAHIWELLDGGTRSFDDVVAALRAAYPDVDETRLRADAGALISSLTAHGLVRAREGTAA